MTAPRFPTAATGDGTTKNFALGFPIIREQHVRVIKNAVLMVRGTDYTIQDATAKNPTVHFLTAPTNGHAIKFYRSTPLALEDVTLDIGPRTALYALYRQQEQGEAIKNIDVDSNATDTAAGTAQSFVSPCDGYIETLRTEVTEAVTTGGPVTVEIDGVAVTGLTTSIADGAAVGKVATDVPTTAQSTTTKVRRGQTVTVTPGALFATAGAYRATVGIRPADLD